MSEPSRAQSIATGILVAIIIVQFVGLLFAFKINDNADQSATLADQQTQISFGLRETQFENCMKSGNVLRDQIREEFVDLKKKVLIPVFAGVAATIPDPSDPARLLLSDTVAYLHHRIHTIGDRIPNVDCLDLYPPLPGQQYASDLLDQATREKPPSGD